MGKQGKNWSQQAPWRDTSNDGGWSYWSGAWRSTGQQPKPPKQGKEDPTQAAMKQFPAYSQIKISDGQRNQDQFLDASDQEDGQGQDYVKGLQRLLNAARRSDARLRKLGQDRMTKTEQWNEFQAALRGKYLEQRSLYQKDIKGLDKELQETVESKRSILHQIQEAVATGGRHQGSATPAAAQPSGEELAAWEAFIMNSPGSKDLTSEDEVIKKALHAAQHPEEFMSGTLTSTGPTSQPPMPGQLADLFSSGAVRTPQRRHATAMPYTPKGSAALGGAHLSSTEESGAATVLSAQYTSTSPRAVSDPYIFSPAQVGTGSAANAPAALGKKSPARVNRARTPIKEGARPHAVAHAPPDRARLADLLHAKRQAAYSELAAHPSSVAPSVQGPSLSKPQVFNIVDDDQDPPPSTGSQELQAME